MKESRIGVLVEPIREMIYSHNDLMRQFRERTGVRIAAVAGDFVPAEIIAAMGLVPVRIPSFTAASGFYGSEAFESIRGAGWYDCIIVPDGFNEGEFLPDNIPVFEFTVPAGYGQEHSVALHNEIGRMLEFLDLPELKTIDISKLQKITGEYDTLRRLVRGIAGLRQSKPDLLSNRDILTLLDSGTVFPPAMITEKFAGILSAMNEGTGSVTRECPAAMVHAGILSDGSVLDDIEEAGFIVTEDDLCNGRRQYDLSFNTASEYLYYEILDACSYRPLCPGIRPVEERYELLYRLIRNYGIETVIFIRDLCSNSMISDIEYLRIKLMRTGVDPLVVDLDNMGDVLLEYINRR